VRDAIGSLTTRIPAVDERVRERCEHLGDLDLASQDVLIEVTRALQKELWMVRSQL
jgi:DNA-binding ferritin-like protein